MITPNFFSLKTCLPATCSLQCNNVNGEGGNVLNEAVAFIATRNCVFAD